MKNENLYYKSVDILLDAYNAGDLSHSICDCAVGNLIKANGGFKGSSYYGQPTACWYRVFLTTVSGGFEFHPKNYYGESKLEIDQTGYSVENLARIERSFESARKKDDEENTQYYGLCAVLDVLRDIHEVDKEEHEASHTRLETIYKKLQTV